jgi:hypothetical protein
MLFLLPYNPVWYWTAEDQYIRLSYEAYAILILLTSEFKILEFYCYNEVNN